MDALFTLWVGVSCIIAFGYAFQLSSRSVPLHNRIIRRDINRNCAAYGQKTRVSSLERSYAEREATGSGGDQKTLYVIPNSPAPMESVVRFIQSWARDQADTGPAISVENEPDGVRFTFTPSPSSSLEFVVEAKPPQESGKRPDLLVQTRMNLHSKSEVDGAVERPSSPQVLSLVQLCANNLIDSLAHEISAVVVFDPNSSDSDNSRARNSVHSFNFDINEDGSSDQGQQVKERMLEQEGKENEIIYLDEEDLDLDALAALESQAKDASELIEQQQQQLAAVQEVMWQQHEEAKEADDSAKSSHSAVSGTTPTASTTFKEQDARAPNYLQDLSAHNQLTRTSPQSTSAYKVTTPATAATDHNDDNGGGADGQDTSGDSTSSSSPPMAEILLQWQTEDALVVPHCIQSIVRTLHRWADKFGRNRAAGLEVELQPHGVDVIFSAVSDARMLIQVQQQAPPSGTTVLLTTQLIEEGRGGDLAEEKTPEQQLVLKAVENLKKNVKQAVAEIKIPTTLNEIQDLPSVGSSSSSSSSHSDLTSSPKISPTDHFNNEESLQGEVWVDQDDDGGRDEFGTIGGNAAAAAAAAAAVHEITLGGVSDNIPMPGSKVIGRNGDKGIKGSGEDTSVFDIPIDSIESIDEATQQLQQTLPSTAANVATTTGARTTATHTASTPLEPAATSSPSHFSSSSPPPPPLRSQTQQAQRQRDPATVGRAAAVGVRLEKFEGKGIEEQAMKELNEMLQSSRKEGFLSVIKNYGSNQRSSSVSENDSDVAVNDNVDKEEAAAVAATNTSLDTLFQRGQELSLKLQEIMSRPPADGETVEDLLKPTPTLPIYLQDNAIAKGEGGIDIFQSPAELYASTAGDNADFGDTSAGTDFVPASSNIAQQLQQELADLISNPPSPPDPEAYELDKQRMNMLMVELNRTSLELQDTVIDSYRDLLMSDNFLFLMKSANRTTADMQTRQFYKKVTEKSIYLNAELGALVKTESMRHLETIQDVCEIAANYQHDEVQFLERMHYVKPRFDTALLSYLNYAIGEEITRQEKKYGINARASPSEWLQVLQIVKQGVMAEFESRYAQLLDPLLLVVRFEDAPLRSSIFQRFVRITPAMELPYMRALAMNMITNVLEAQRREEQESAFRPYSSHSSSHSVKGEGGDTDDAQLLVQRMKDLKRDLDLYLNDDIIQARVEEFESEARKQGKSVVVRNRNPVVQAEIESVQELNRNANINMDYSEDSVNLLGNPDL